jgi:DNA-binding winged helix-turn-helix (wHTH) protein/TolB-like protein
MLNTTSGPKARRYVFSTFTFDVESGELIRNRRTERIRRQTSRLLTILLERAGTVVSRDELRERMWPGGEYLDHERSINRSINELREILRDDPQDPKFIETLPKRGYRFRSDVKVETAAALEASVTAAPAIAAALEPLAISSSQSVVKTASMPPSAVAVGVPIGTASPRTRRWIFAVAAALFLVSGALTVWRTRWSGSRPQAQSKIVHIAIVPFDTQGESAGPLAESFRLDLMDTVAQLPDVELYTAHSMDRNRMDDAALENLARALHLDMLLLGHFVVDGNRCTLQMELVRAHDMAHLASFQYKSPRDGLFRVRGDIQRDLFKELQLAGNPQLAVRGSPQDAQAYNNYLEARDLAGRSSVDSLMHALALYQSAIDRDPGFARAYAGMARVHLALSSEDGFGAHLQLARQVAEQALQRDPYLAEAHAVLGGVAFDLDWDAARAEAELRRAVSLEPHNSVYHAWLAKILVSTGRFDEGLQQVDMARAEDPLWPDLYLIEAFSAGVSHHPARMIAAAKAGLALLPASADAHDAFAWSYRDALAWSYVTTGHYKNAGDEWRALAQMEKDAPRVALEDGSSAALLSGGLKAWAAVRARAIEAHDKGTLRHPNDFVPAEWYAMAGERNKALAELRKMIDRHDSECMMIAVNPMFYPLHHDPGFLKLLARIGPATHASAS